MRACFYCICIRYKFKPKVETLLLLFLPSSLPSIFIIIIIIIISSGSIIIFGSRSDFDRRFEAICFHLEGRERERQRHRERNMKHVSDSPHTATFFSAVGPKGANQSCRKSQNSAAAFSYQRFVCFTFALFFLGLFDSSLLPRQSDKPQVRGVCNLLFASGPILVLVVVLVLVLGCCC